MMQTPHDAWGYILQMFYIYGDNYETLLKAILKGPK